ncbi:MAG: TIM barrel protein, partial [Candidatus Korarchaeota archaeon]
MKLAYVLKYPEEKNLVDDLYHFGYDGVEWAMLDPKEYHAHETKISALGTGRNYTELGLSLSDPDENIRLKAISRVNEFIELGAKINVPVIIGLIRGVVKGTLGETLERLRRSVEVINRTALDNGITLLFEPLNRYESYLNTVEETVSFIKDYESCKILVDSYHFNIEERNFWEPIIQYRNYIAHVHVADNNRLWPGNAHINFV